MSYFKNIHLSYYRNFENSHFDFSKNCNVFYGENGSGKTNLLEAISLFSKGRGIRKDKLSQIIKKKKINLLLNQNFFMKRINII